MFIRKSYIGKGKKKKEFLLDKCFQLQIPFWVWLEKKYM